MAAETTDNQIIPIVGTGNRVIIEQDKGKEVSKNGILLGYDVEPNTGVVTHVSEIDLDGHKPALSVGDKVMFHSHGGSPIKLNDKNYKVFVERDIFLKFIPNE